MQPVHVLVRVQGQDNGALVQMGRQWELHQDPVNAGVVVELPDLAKEVFLGDLAGQPDGLRPDADLLARSPLVANVHGGCGIVPHQDHRKARDNAMLGLEVGDSQGRLAADVLRGLVPVYDYGAHGSPLTWFCAGILA